MILNDPFDLAVSIYNNYNHKYVYDDINWYNYSGIWKIISTDEVIDEFSSYININDSNIIDSVMRECRDMFLDETISDRLDSNQDLIGFSNGTLDLRELRFRPSRAWDYISLSTGYNFETSPELIEEGEYILNSMFTDSNIARYFSEYSSRILKGGDNNRICTVFSGDTTNLIEFYKSIFGEYFQIIDNLYLNIIPSHKGCRVSLLENQNIDSVSYISRYLVNRLMTKITIFDYQTFKNSLNSNTEVSLLNRIRVIPEGNYEPLPDNKRSAIMAYLFEVFKEILTYGPMIEPIEIRNKTNEIRYGLNSV